MSVYIREMEMPRCCAKCALVTQYYDGGLDVCCLLDKYAARQGTLDDCPLIPVPDHGRLIEWISVKEKLPEVGKPVLCACRANIFEVMKMRTDGAWAHNDAVYDSTYLGGFVTHWAELPTIIEADKEKADEN